MSDHKLVKRAFELYTQHKELIEYDLLDRAHMKYNEFLDVLNRISEDSRSLFNDFVKIRPTEYMVTFDIVGTKIYRESEEFDFDKDISSHENLIKLCNMGRRAAEYRLSLTKDAILRGFKDGSCTEPTLQNLKLWKRKDNYVWEEIG